MAEPEHSNSQMRMAIDEWVHNETHRRLLKRRLIDGRHFEPLAEEFDLSVGHVKSLVKRYKAILLKHI